MSRHETTGAYVYFVNTLSGGLATLGAWAGAGSSGLTAIVSRSLPDDWPSWSGDLLVLAASAFVAMVIQTMIVGMWSSVFRYGVVRSADSLLAGLAASLASGYLSAGAGAFLFAYSDIAWNKRQEATAPVVEELLERVSSFDGFAEAMETAAALSLRLASEEERTGATCGAPAGKTCGPRCNFRKRQAERMTADAATASDLASSLLSLSTDLRSGRADDDAAAYRRAQNLLRSGEAVGLRRSLALSLDELTNGFVDPENSRRYECRTPELENRLTGLAASLAHTIAPPESAPPAPVRPSFTDGFVAVHDALASLFSAPEAARATPVGLSGLALAGLVELLQILLLRRKAAARRDLALDDDRDKAFWAARRDLPPDARTRLARVLDLVDRQTLRVEGRAYFVVPEGAGPNEREPVFYFNLPAPKGGEAGVELAALKPDWIAALRDRFGDARRFDLYRLPPEIAYWSRSTFRDAREQTHGV